MKHLLLPLCLLFAFGCTIGSDYEETDEFDFYQDALNAPLPPGAVRIDFDRFETEATDRSAYDLAVRYRDKKNGFKADPLGGKNGFAVFPAKKSLSAKLRADSSGSARRESTHQFLATLPGQWSTFSVLQTESHPQRVVLPVYRGFILVQTLREEITGTGLAVFVHSATPQAVDIELIPFYRRALDRRTYRVEDLSTRLILKPGVPYVTAAEQSDTASFAWNFLTYRSEQGSSQLLYVLTVEVGKEDF